ncbi:type 4a pilus biogenesis protein PilO [Geobacter argillaceus]|uniref:Type IV pilus assembly protein PilO n=1 Tax=Geobacter argillaceus TaxID=345631 RepID=A0A562VN07_9BACT|nr:type 4a pilus biogenesis protein PilO [Geobacter argillaceus]TWJ19151.1 type IV pilus assembly protein PilO [Geobacter argillaceus]
MTRKQVLDIARQRRIPLAAIVLLLVANVLAYGYLTAYQQPELDRIRGEWFAKRRMAVGEKDQSRPALYAQGVRELEEWRARVMVKKDFAPFLSRLFSSASRRNLQLAGITYKPAVESGKSMTSYAIGFSVKGKYGEIKSFLSDLLAMREMVVVDGIDLSNSKSTEEQVELRMQLTAYFRLERP